MIKFLGKEIPGHHQSIIASPPTLIHKKRSFFGVQGESLVVSHRGSRELTCRIWLNSPTWKMAAGKRMCESYLKDLEQTVGSYGTVEETLANSTRKFMDCVFLGFEEQPVDGDSSGPIPDEGGMLNDGLYTWWIQGTLKWIQLNPDKLTVAN